MAALSAIQKNGILFFFHKDKNGILFFFHEDKSSYRIRQLSLLEKQKIPQFRHIPPFHRLCFLRLYLCRGTVNVPFKWDKPVCLQNKIPLE